MVFDIQQTKTNFHMEWIATDRVSGAQALVRAPFTNGKFQADLIFPQVEPLSLYFNPSDTTWGSKLSDRLSFKIFREGGLFGRIVGNTRKIGFLKSYPYYEITFNNTMYYGYEVGFGRKGLYLCIYKGDELVAIVDKALRVINYKDCYSAYLVSEQYAEVVLAFVIYYDVTAYGNVMEISLLSVSEKWVNTIQPQLIEKYDPTFIPRIKAMDGVE